MCQPHDMGKDVRCVFWVSSESHEGGRLSKLQRKRGGGVIDGRPPPHGASTPVAHTRSAMRGPSNKSVAVLAVTASTGSFSLGYFLVRRCVTLTWWLFIAAIGQQIVTPHAARLHSSTRRHCLLVAALRTASDVSLLVALQCHLASFRRAYGGTALVATCCSNSRP